MSLLKLRKNYLFEYARGQDELNFDLRLKRLGRDLESVISRPEQSYSMFGTLTERAKSNVFRANEKSWSIDKEAIAIKQKVDLGLPLYTLAAEN